MEFQHKVTQASDARFEQLQHNSYNSISHKPQSQGDIRVIER